MNVSEYIVSYLEEKNIGRVFGVVGGAILWFCKALNESKKIKPVFTNHEQAAAMAADGWARVSGKPGVVFSINGPGMTNTITGIAQAWVDSSPVILITGNSNLKSVQYERDAEVRQYGTQDVRTDKLMESITKKHFLLENAEDVKACMEEAYHLAVTGRPGPVCIEIPINVQSAKISNSVLGEEKIFINSVNVSETNCSDINLVLEKLSIAKRPLILAGQGVRLSGTTEKFRKFVEQYQIPVANSRMGIDTIESDNQYFVGRAGNHGSRPAHFALQTCDVLLILGSRLAPNTTGYDVGKFSNQSYKILVDVDKKELDKFGITVDQNLHMDLRTFFDLLEKKTDVRSTAGQKIRERWIACCNEWKMKYPIMQSRYYHDSEISTYRVVEAVSDLAGADDFIISDTGSCCSIVAQVWQVKGNQRVFISGGLSAMGYWAMSMGVAAANQGKSNVICFAGDGSLQMNIHELATIRQYGFPIKIFIINNSGYQFVRMSQSAYGIDPPFGTDVDKGVPIPDTKKLANAYGLNYCCCDKAAGLKDVIRDVLESEEAQLCEIFVAKDQEVCPRLKSIALEDGTFVSPDYENLYPFLDAEVLEKEIKQAYV